MSHEEEIYLFEKLDDGEEANIIADAVVSIGVAEISKMAFNPSIPSYEFCMDCDCEIPKLRRNLGNVKRCVDCQQLFDDETDRYRRNR